MLTPNGQFRFGLWVEQLNTQLVIVLYKSKLIHIIFQFSLGLGFDTMNNKINKLCLQYTVYSTHYKMYHKDQSLVYGKQLEGEDIRIIWF